MFKLVSQKRGYNQVDKRWVRSYQSMWDIPEEITELLEEFTGTKKPISRKTRDPRRAFLTEMTELEQNKIAQFFQEKKTKILLDILKGNGKFSVEWILVIVKGKTLTKWGLAPINDIVDLFNGPIAITKQGSLKIGKVTMQRKGGDNGAETSCMLQFKIDPVEILTRWENQKG